MAAFDQTKVLAQYSYNDGTTSKRKIFNGYYTQAELGYVAGVISDKTVPKGFRCRHATVKTAGGLHRKVIVATVAAMSAMVPGTTTLTIDVGGVQTTATVNALEGEHSIGQG